jgi:predicted AAA+ superfamily ATPase
MADSFIKRDLSRALTRYSKFPVVAILGPRQSGKTTLVKHHFKKHAYANLEDPALRSFCIEDPRRFLKEFGNKNGIIIDEFQYAPELLSYIQVAVDEKKELGYFVLTGSQNFLMNQAITQSLAGRVGILTLLPLSLHEQTGNHLISDVDAALLQGSYPRLFEAHIAPSDFYPSYIHTYLERDVRQIANIGDILVFQKLMRLCAGRIGQLLNIADLATQLGIDQRKVKQWLSILEASYIIFLLKPHFKNFHKRLTKTPKLYFYDTGIACSLLDLKTAKTIALSPYRGHLFESMIISDFQKQYYNAGMGIPSTYFWRDQNGRLEIDCVIDRGDKLFPIEIKSGQTINPSFFDALREWSQLAETPLDEGTIIYAGEEVQSRSRGKVLGWHHSTQLIPQLYDGHT